MYLRWAERDGFEVEMIDRQDGEEAGIKSATFAVRGLHAYGYLSGEAGVHRLVRISPYDFQARRHTSFASVDVYPEVDDEVVIEIADKDLRVDTFRSSGAGGQHVNKTESAVRLTHLPTGIVVSCQNERSQIKNRAMAMKVLRSRLYDREMQKRADEQAVREGNKKDNAWGSQIRSYVLHPYRMVKDHRTGAEVGDADRVLDGGLDPFIEAWLKGPDGGARRRRRGALMQRLDFVSPLPPVRSGIADYSLDLLPHLAALADVRLIHLPGQPVAPAGGGGVAAGRGRGGRGGPEAGGCRSTRWATTAIHEGVLGAGAAPSRRAHPARRGAAPSAARRHPRPRRLPRLQGHV
jgi:protein subunit release factor B